jgi:alpha-L-rhamnosidase
MNPFNHYSLGSCGQWLYSDVGGIALDPAHPGFDRFVLRPAIGGPLTSAATTFRSIRGLIATDWSVTPDRQFTLKVTVPVNTTAVLVLPAAQGAEIRESGARLADVKGVKELERGAQTARLELGSGSYLFMSRY